MSTNRKEAGALERGEMSKNNPEKAPTAAEKAATSVTTPKDQPKRKERSSSNPSSTSPPPPNKGNFSMQETSHTLNTLPPKSILVHSTNCFGTWGAGVALAIHELFPVADAVYAAHCNSLRPSPDAWPERAKIVGTCLLIPPQPGDFAASEGGIWIACIFNSYGFGRQTKRKASLDSKGKIVAQTESSLNDFKKQMRKLNGGEYEIEDVKGEDGQNLKVLRLKEAGESEGTSAPKRRKKVGQKKEDGEQNLEAKEEQGDVGSEETSKLVMDIYSPQFNSGAFGVKWEETTGMVEDIFNDWEGNWFVLSPPK